MEVLEGEFEIGRGPSGRVVRGGLALSKQSALSAADIALKKKKTKCGGKKKDL